MYYVYVLRSLKDKQLYIGFTEDIKRRFLDHNTGKVQSTHRRVPFEVIYYEASRNKNDAIKREKYLKSTYGGRYLKNRLKNDLYC